MPRLGGKIDVNYQWELTIPRLMRLVFFVTNKHPSG